MERGGELRGALVGVSTAPMAGIRLGGLVRYAVYGCLLVASLMFYVWSRADVQSASVQLERSQVELAGLKNDNDRLRLELASRRDLAGLAASAEAIGLVRGAPVVEVRK